LALVAKTIAQLNGGEPGGSTGAYVLVRYQDTNELIEYAEAANHMPRVVNAEVVNNRTGEVVFRLALQPVAAGQINTSASWTGGNRPKLEEFNVSL
jgi:hypothetical protein